ncbi:uncharacterized protein LY79DRAFT_542448 [Colletotrichum navitas]|uniref:Uncharacterized protein n=1 Tax=Colletotrichum navitas TaxID=681940 RepID=A0AAD8Q941_9PEZI|nr:uncharacterized protein LY79DRAFT_542448 [Colletotrichum navitas]KAK1597193.1 hypothetical protein LY79DRAFT_542448 [Colletotrichum navitas]
MDYRCPVVVRWDWTVILGKLGAGGLFFFFLLSSGALSVGSTLAAKVGDEVLQVQNSGESCFCGGLCLLFNRCLQGSVIGPPPDSSGSRVARRVHNRAQATSKYLVFR